MSAPTDGNSTSVPAPASPAASGGAATRGPRRSALTTAFTVAYWSFFFAMESAGFCLLLPFYLASTPFDRARNRTHAFICRYTFALTKIWPGWDIRVLHRERLPDGAAVLVCNHQSAADVIVTMGLSHPFKFVSKHTLFALPVVGWAMRLAKYVSVDRGKVRSTRQMMKRCRELLSSGTAILVFPEATYSLEAGLLPFKKGAFALAIEAGVPVVPIVIEGTPDLIWDDGPLLSPRANVRVTVLEPLPASELGADPVALAARVRAIFEQALGLPPTASTAATFTRSE